MNGVKKYEWGLWARQIGAIMRLEMRKTFFAKRGLWVYLLAAAPALLFFAYTMVQKGRAAGMAARASITTEQANQVKEKMTPDEVRGVLGRPHSRFTHMDPDKPRSRRRDPDAMIEVMQYSDGKSDYVYRFKEGKLFRTDVYNTRTLTDDNVVYATIFQLFYLRLAIFFGCVGVFMNLFRGELIDKSLHFYLLAPIRREVLLAGKYCAGLLATGVIFGVSTIIQLWTVYGSMPAAQSAEFWERSGASTLFAYVGVTALACMGYGAVFLVAGLIWRNPIIPAATLLVWEGANIFLPATLKKISIIHYLQSLCPIPASPSGSVEGPLKLLISITEPTAAPIAIGGLLIVTAGVLVLGAWQARRLEINYSTE